MQIKIVQEGISIQELSEIAREFYATMIKGMVDVDREVVAFGGEWHADANHVLIENGSLQQNLWGFNYYLDKPVGFEIEYTSLMNIRPAQGNRQHEVSDPVLRGKMREIIIRKIVK